MPIWLNNDGLRVKTGRDEVGKGTLGPEGRGGTVNPVGSQHIIEFQISAADFAAGVYTLGANKLLSDTTSIPNGWRVSAAEIFVETTFVGATGTLDIGLVAQDTTTVINATGLFSAVAVASLVTGARIVGTGALVGVANVTPTALLTARNSTARFTAGSAIVRVTFYNPVG